MNKKKSLALLFTAVVPAVCILLASLHMSDVYTSSADNTTGGTYTLRIDGSNPFVVGEDPISTLNAYTKNGNLIVFEAMNIESQDNYLCVLPDDSGTYSYFVKNRTPIDGIIGFKAVFADEDISDHLFVEWVNDSTGQVDSAVALNNQYVDISSSIVMNPSYLKFTATDYSGNKKTAIQCIEYYYSCTPTEHSEFPSYLKAEIINGKAYISEYISLSAGTRTINIPACYQGYPVVGIKDASVFNSDNSVGYVYLPDSITSIPAGAFSWCQRLTGIRMSNNITSIPNSAFYNCNELLEFDFSSNIKSIGSNAFYNTGLSGQIVLPSSVTSVGSGAFGSFGGSKVDSIVVSSNVSISKDGYNPSIILHTDVKTGTAMLSGVYGVTDTTVYQYNIDSKTYFKYVKYDVGDGESLAIVSCNLGQTTASSIFTIPSDIDGLPITYIGPSAFDSSSVSQLVLPYDLMYLGDDAFKSSGITLLRSFDGLQMIGKNCFGQSTYTSRDNYLNLYLNTESIKYIGYGAFKNLNTRLYFDGSDPTSLLPYGWDSSIKSKTIYTNQHFAGPYDIYPIDFVTSENVAVDVYHNINMTYISRDRNKDYLKDLSTGEPTTVSTGSILFRINCETKDFTVDDIAISSSGATVTSLGNQIFRIDNLASFAKVTLTAPAVEQTRTVTLVPSGTMSPFFYDDPSSMLEPAEGLTHLATDIDGNPSHDDTGMVSFKINPGQYKKPVFNGDCIVGTYDHYTISKDKVTIYGVASDLTVNLQETNDYYTVDFTYDEGVDYIIVYPTQTYTSTSGEITDSTVSRDPTTGLPASSYSYSKPQVNFEFVLKEGYALSSISITPSSGYKNLKIPSGNIRRITVITTNLVVNITTSLQ